MVHTRGCLYADENDQGVGEELTVKKGKDTDKMRWKPKDSGLRWEQWSFIHSKRRKAKNVDILGCPVMMCIILLL